jgi:hypothetical protein
LPQQRFGKIRRNSEAGRRSAAAQNHLALASEVARRAPCGAFDRRHLLAQRLAACDQIHQLAVEFGQCGSQFIEIHVEAVPWISRIPFYRPTTATASAAARLTFSYEQQHKDILDGNPT